MVKKARKAVGLTLLCGLVCTAPIVGNVSTVAAEMSQNNQAKLAGYWSPILYQDVGDNPEGDIPTLVNFDGDWVGTNNWENIPQYGKGKKALYPRSYWSLVESETHYFIGYNLFYATHDPDGTLGDHENDMEGMMLVIRKSGVARKDGSIVTNASGELELALIGRHAKLTMFGSPDAAARYAPGRDTVYYDGTIATETNGTGIHLKVYSAQNNASYLESEGDFGHALKVYAGGGAKGETGYIFQCSGDGAAATNMNQAGQNFWNSYLGDFVESKRLNYGLVPLETSIWPLRNDMSLGLWSSYGTFKGDTGRENAANAPWGWSFENYRDLGSGTILTDPANYVDALFDDLGTFSKVYLTNPYTSE